MLSLHKMRRKGVAKSKVRLILGRRNRFYAAIDHLHTTDVTNLEDFALAAQS